MSRLLVVAVLALWLVQHPAAATPTPGSSTPTAQEPAPCALPFATPVLGLIGTPTTGPGSPRAANVDVLVTAAEHVIACLNAGRVESLVTLVTPNFLRTAIGVDDPAAAAPAMDFPPFAVEWIGDARLEADGQGSVEVVYRREAGQHMLVRERWFFVAGDRGWLLDALESLPVSVEGERADVSVLIVGHAYELELASVTDGEAVVFAVTNETDVAHEFAVFRTPAGMTRETFVAAGGDGAEFVGAVLVGPGGQGELALVGLEPGDYTAACFFAAPDGRSYAAHGMVSSFTVR